MKNKMIGILGFICMLGISTSSVQATLLSYWNFNNQTAGSGGAAGTFNTSGSSEIYNLSEETISIATGGEKASGAKVNFSNLAGNMGGAANNNWGTFTGDVANVQTGDIAGGALAVIGSGNNNHYIDFVFSTQGYEDIGFSYATRGTSTGYTTQSWSYSTNGTTFIPIDSKTGRNVTSWSVQTLNNLSSLAALDNKSEVIIRLTFSGATSTSGNNRIDNVQISGTQIVPEPAMMGLLISGLGFLSLYRRYSGLEL